MNTDTTTTTNNHTMHHHNANPEETPMGAISDAYTEKQAGLAATDDVSKVEAARRSEEDDIVYPHGLALWIILAGLCLGVFLVALDQTIIATAIPRFVLSHPLPSKTHRSFHRTELQLCRFEKKLTIYAKTE